MISMDFLQYQQVINCLRELSDSAYEESNALSDFSGKIGSAWISQSSGEYCERISKLVSKMRGLSDDFRGIADRMSAHLNAMRDADKEAAAIIGGGSSGGSPSSSSPSGSGVIDRYKAKDYSSIGCGGTSGYLGDGGYYYQDDASGGDPAVAPFNDNSGWVSCTFSTMYRLHKKGLGYPFATVGNTSGGQWFDNYAGAPENRYTGVDGFRQMIAEYMASDQTEPLRNVVVSFDSGQYGHVMLIDGIHKNGEITFYDNSWGSGFETKLYANDLSLESAMAAVDSAPVHGMQVEEFLKHYGYMHMNGAVIIGNN